MPTGMWTNEGIAKINDTIANGDTLPINKFVLSGAATVGGLTDPFVEDANLTEATFPDEIYRADTDQIFIDGDSYLVVDSEILAGITDEFYANGIGLIYDDGLGGKWLLAIAALPLQGRKEGVFTRYRFKLPISGEEEGIQVNYSPDDHVTPTELGAAIAGHGHWNAIINGCARVIRGDDYTLVKDAYGFGKVDRFEGMATGTTVDAGTLTQKLNSGLFRNGFSLHFSGVTLTGSGILYLRQRMESADAKHFKNQKASFAARLLHDVGVGVDYTVFVRKADAEDDFSSTTEIANSGAIAVASGTNSDLLFENIDMGDCSNGIEIEIKVEAGTITTKNFEFAELQLEIGAVATAFDLRPIIQEKALCRRPAILSFIEAQHNHSDFETGGGIGFFPSGTKMLFFQASAPTGWTQDTSHDDKMLRVVSASGGASGGSDSPIATHTHNTQGHVLAVSEMPAHTHDFDYNENNADGGAISNGVTGPNTKTTTSTGGGNAHDHGATTGGFAPKYVDIIICTKD